MAYRPRPHIKIDTPNLFKQDGRYRYRFDISPKFRPWFGGKATKFGTLNTLPAPGDDPANLMDALKELAPIRAAHRAKIAHLKALPPEALTRGIAPDAAAIEDMIPDLPPSARQAIDRVGGPLSFLEAYAALMLMKDFPDGSPRPVRQPNGQWRFIEPPPVPSDLTKLPDEQVLAAVRQQRHKASRTAMASDLEGLLAPALTAFGLTQHADTLSVVVQQWLGAEKRQPATLRRIGGQIRRLIEALGDVAVQSITSRQLNSFVDAVSGLPSIKSFPLAMQSAPFPALVAWSHAHPEVPPMETTSRNNYVATLKALFGWMASREIIESDPSRSLRRLRDQRGDSEKKRRFTHDELVRIASAVDDRWKEGSERHLLFRIAAYTGMRLQEPCGLRKSDVVDRDGHLFFRVHHNEYRRLKTNGSEREIPVHSDLVPAVLERLEAVALPNDLLFPSYPPKRSQALSEQFSALIHKHAGIDEADNVTWHSLRHSWEWRAVHVARIDEPTRCALAGEKQKGRQGLYDTAPGRAELIAAAEKMAP